MKFFYRTGLWLLLILGLNLIQAQSLETGVDSLLKPVTLNTQENIDSASVYNPLPPLPPTPLWVSNNRILNRRDHYYGIGKSTIGQEEANNEARLNYSRNVFTHVQSMVEHSIQENNFKIKEEFKSINTVSSDVSLRGMSITEEFYDSNSRTWYALMKYKKDEYDILIAEEIFRELERMKKENVVEEKREKEKVRHEFALMKIDSLKAMTIFNRERTDESIKAEEHKRKLQRKRYLKKNYSDFIAMKPSHTILNAISAEVPDNTHTFGLKSILEPYSIIQTSYHLRLFRVFEGALRVYYRDGGIINQDSHIKVQLLSGNGEIYRTSIALGYEQYSSHLNEINAIIKNTDQISVNNSLFFTANINLPEQYLVLKLFNNKRKTSLALQWFPFFENFSKSLSLAANMSYIRGEAFRNRHGHRFVFEPGIQFVVIPHRFQTLLAWEQNEFFTLSMDVQF
ncbi:LPP20 family lipoprotein [bacterium]|nr:LPP20 family lipoprotein [bacterium]